MTLKHEIAIIALHVAVILAGAHAFEDHSTTFAQLAYGLLGRG